MYLVLFAVSFPPHTMAIGHIDGHEHIRVLAQTVLVEIFHPGSVHQCNSVIVLSNSIFVPCEKIAMPNHCFVRKPEMSNKRINQ